jgi:hypothetical protein
MVKIEIRRADLFTVDADVLVFKHAGAFFGADRAAADLLGANKPRPLNPGDFRLIRNESRHFRANHLLFIGVVNLFEFRYQELQSFWRELVSLARRELPSAGVIATTVHGVGYGLDEQEAVLAFLSGISDAIRLTEQDTTAALHTVCIVERDPRRAARVERCLEKIMPSAATVAFRAPLRPKIAGSDNVPTAEPPTTVRLDIGRGSEQKPHIFVAMPFADDYLDEWEIGIQEAVNSHNFLCERLDAAAEAYVGDVLMRIKHRIDTCSLLIGVLTGDNPNVYLEIGYAWGKGKPTILVVRDGHNVKFDVRGQRYLKYHNIADLRKKMRQELTGLVSSGVV